MNLTSEEIRKILDYIYEKSITGFPFEKNIYELVNDYRTKSYSTEEAICSLIRFQMLKTTTTGFITNLGGVIMLPVSIPVDVANCLSVNLRMIAGIAILRGHDLMEDQVKACVYLSLLGISAINILRDIGIQIGNKMTKEVLKKISGKILTKINQEVGYRLVTKTGSKGIIVLEKGIPIIGGFVGGGINLVETLAIAKMAKVLFTDVNSIK